MAPNTVVAAFDGKDNLASKIADFQRDVKSYLSGPEPSRVVLASAWLVSDNVIVDLFKRFTDFFPTIVGVDTLHLFPETHDVVRDMEAKYGFKTATYKPEGCETLDDFVKKFGKHQDLTHADFDKHSKVDPLMKAFDDFKKEIAITGRRADQGNARVSLAVWEEDKKTFNPLANWSWADVCEYVLYYRVPFNALHRRLSIADEFVFAPERETYTKFKYVDLTLPYFAYDPETINAHGAHVYIWKSFGDTHTTVPVSYDESERAGRFVGRLQTECGIHTRIVPKGAPHGGVLIDLLTTPEASPLAKATQKLELNERQACDFELLVNGGFSPLTGFMDEKTYDTVVNEYRLPEGQLFGLPVTLDTDSEEIKVGDFVELLDPLYGGHGVIEVESKWAPNRSIESEKVYGTTSQEHPSVWHLLTEKKKYNIGGRVWGFKLPLRPWVDCKTPKDLRAELPKGKNVVAFQSRNPLHRAHTTMFLNVYEEYQGAEVLVHPVVGPTKDDDIPAIVRKETYDALAKKLDHVKFEYLPYSMVVGGPREALQHALIRKNYGCTHMIMGRDHAGCKDKSGKDFYGPWDAQDFVLPLQKELGIDIVPFKAMVFAEEEDKYVPEEVAKAKGYHVKNISGTKFRAMLLAGEPIPDWFAYTEVVEVLRRYAKEQQ